MAAEASGMNSERHGEGPLHKSVQQGGAKSKAWDKEKPPAQAGGFIWRRGRDLNPRTLWVTRFPSVRAKPDYATSPFQAGQILPPLSVLDISRIGFGLIVSVGCTLA